MKRLVSIMLSLAILFSCTNTLATTIQVNVNNTIREIETDENRYFNVEFTQPDYVPVAEQVYSVIAGNNIEMWRYSGDQDKSQSGSQNWRTQWGVVDDEWIRSMMRDEKDLLTTTNQKIPDEVLNYINSGGSWNDIKVTFQPMNSDGVWIDKNDIFKNGVVDCWLKYGTEFEFKFYPHFKASKQYVCENNNVKIYRGRYPYSYTAFSMWDKNGAKRQYGSAKVWDSENGEPIEKYNGFDALQYSDIQGPSGILNGGLNVKNFTYPWKTETGQQSQSGISTDVAKIGSGTFSNGGATGVGFSFPIKITFEINPVPVKETKIISEAGYVNVNDIDNTISNLQLYSNRNDFVEILKLAHIDKMMTQLRNDTAFRNKVTESLISVEDRKDSTKMDFARGVMNSVINSGILNDENVFKFYKNNTGTLDVLSDNEIDRMLSSNSKIVLGHSFMVAINELYNDLIGNINNEDLKSNDMTQLLYNNKKLAFNNFDTSIIYNGNLKSFIEGTKNYKATYSLPTLYYNYNDKEVNQDVLRQYSTAITREMAKKISGFDNGVFTFKEDNTLLSGAVVDGKTGYYTLDKDYLLGMVKDIDNNVGNYNIKLMDESIVKMKNTGVLADEKGGAEYVANTDGMIRIYSKDILDSITLSLTGFVDYSGMTFEDTSTEGVLKYNGVYSYSGLVNDYGCDVKMDIIKINTDDSVEKWVDSLYVGTANRYEPFDGHKNYLTENGYVITRVNETKYKPVVIAYSEKSDNEIDSAVLKLLGSKGKYNSGVYVIDGVRIAVGDSAIKSSALYPTEEQLKNQSDIKVRAYIKDLEPTKICVNYVDECNKLIENRIGDAYVDSDGKVWACIADEYSSTFDLVCAFVSDDKPKRGLVSDITWDEISRDCSTADAQWLTAPGFVWVNGNNAQTVYVKAMRKAVDSSVNGSFNLGQQRISKVFNTADVYMPNLKTFVKVDTTRHQIVRSYRSGGRLRKQVIDCVINNNSSDPYNLTFNTWSNANDKIAVGSYGTQVSNNSTGNKYVSLDGTTSDKVNPNMRFVLWRGDDKPVAASYADSGYNNEALNKFGIGSSNKYQSSGIFDNYIKNIRLYYGVDDYNSDKNVTFNCSLGRSHNGVVNGDSKSKDTSLAVNVFTGWKGTQNAVSGGSDDYNMNGINMTSVSRNSVTQNAIGFYPYVNMKYEDMDGNIKDLNVLSKYASSIKPVSTVEIGYRAGGSDSIGITSNMWSTHARALKAHGSNSTLVGGSTYKLQNNIYNQPVVGVKSYSWYVPNDSIDAVYEGSYGNTQADAEQTHNNLVWDIKSKVNNTPVKQRIDINGNMITPYKGGVAGWLNNIPFEKDDKYWFGNRNVRANDSNLYTTKDYYRISSDTNGNVILTHGSNTDFTFNKYNTNEYILSALNDEWKDVNDKTGLVSCYLYSIIRHEGNDSEFTDDGKWYSEAFPGLCVCVETSTFNVELNPEVANFDNVLNLRYVPAHTDMTDVFTKYFKSWFSADWVTLNGNYRGQTVGAGAKDLNLRTKDFFIPNATVYDND